MKIITISGLDGSGKSTQIQLLKNYLESQGKRVFYFHAIKFSLANKLSGNKNSGASPSVTKSNFFKIWLRKLFLHIDFFRFKKLHKKLENDGFDYILSDRYFFDSIINIKYLEQQNNNLNLEIKNCKLIENLKLKIENSKYFYLQADPEQIMQRERKPDQGIDYLKTKKELYDKFAPEFGLKIINGNRNKEEIFEEIKNNLEGN